MFLTIKVDGAAHEHQGSIEALLVVGGVEVPPSVINNLVLDAFLLALMVDANIPENTQTELSDLLAVRLG